MQLPPQLSRENIPEPLADSDEDISSELDSESDDSEQDPLQKFQKKKVSFSPQIISVNDEFDQGSQSGEGGQSGGATGSQASD